MEEEFMHSTVLHTLVVVSVLWDTIWTLFRSYPNRKRRRGYEDPILSAILSLPPCHCSRYKFPILHL